MTLNNIDQLLQKAAEVQGDEEIKSVLKDINEHLKTNTGNIELLFAKAELNTKLQNFGSAINDYRNILLVDHANSKARTRIDDLKTILKYQNTDIFENPNTNFDPWLD